MRGSGGSGKESVREDFSVAAGIGPMIHQGGKAFEVEISGEVGATDGGRGFSGSIFLGCGGPILASNCSRKRFHGKLRSPGSPGFRQCTSI